MDEKRIIEIQSKVAGLLLESRLKQAIDTLEEIVDEEPKWGLRSQFNEMQTAYK